MGKEDNQIGANFDDIKFNTKIKNGVDVICTVSFDLMKYTTISYGVGGYDKQYSTGNYCKITPIKGFDIDKEKDLIRSIICTIARRKEIDDEKCDYREHRL